MAIAKFGTRGVSTIIDELASFNKDMIVKDGKKGIIGTSIPYQFNLFSDIITNPSSVSISEFQKMVDTSPILSAGLTTFNNLIKLEIGGWIHSNKKYQEFMNDMIKNMNRPFNDIYNDMLTSLISGYFVGEKYYESDGRYIHVKDIEPRPAQSIIFRVDSQGHLKDDGIIQYFFNNLWTGYGNLLAYNAVTTNGINIPNPYAARGDLDYPWRTVWAQPLGTVILPKNKCVHFAYKGMTGLTSPYGKSLLRSAYDYYLQATAMNKIMINAANFKSSPVPVIIYNPNQANTEDGEDPYDELVANLENLGDADNGKMYLAIKGDPEAVKIDSIESAANLNDIVLIRKYIDTMILTAILYPSELAGLSDKGSYALGKSQADLLGRNVKSIAESLKDCLLKQFYKPLLESNFNEQEDFGSFQVKEDVAEDVALNLDKLNTLKNEGIKLKSEAIMEMLDLKLDMIESVQKIIDPAESKPQEPNMGNYGLNANFNRRRPTGGDK